MKSQKVLFGILTLYWCAAIAIFSYLETLFASGPILLLAGYFVLLVTGKIAINRTAFLDSMREHYRKKNKAAVYISYGYAVLFLLLKRTMDVGRDQVPGDSWRPAIDRRLALQLFIIYAATALAVSASGVGIVFLVLSWFVWAGIAILCLGFSLRDALGRHRDDAIDVEPVILVGE